VFFPARGTWGEFEIPEPPEGNGANLKKENQKRKIPNCMCMSVHVTKYLINSIHAYCKKLELKCMLSSITSKEELALSATK
jgi:hypothetical protein